MSAELFPREPYEHFELQSPRVELLKDQSPEQQPHVFDFAPHFYGAVALFALRHDGEYALEHQEAV